ncbi:MAG: sigma-54-dependent Fis family transcriptional regulator [Gammaproteobacteria bacterium]|nr:sigma-54-dependent Fis family transcriptional regulator [Gammaproteobacteria bacterium]
MGNSVANINSFADSQSDLRYLKHRSILVLDDEPGIRNFLVKGLGKYLGLIESADCFESADELRQRCHFDLIIADIKLPGGSGVDWVKRLRESGCTTSVIFITAHAHLSIAIEAIRAGAADFIIKPFRMDQIITAIDRCIERQDIKRENFVLRRQVDKIFTASGMVGTCEVMTNLCDVIKRVAPMPSTILLEGESGTGKELAARSIHDLSERSGIFVPVNCGAISAELLESELFGHVKGAFTGAHQAREGLFGHASGGTLFLDEIGEMPLAMQAHLLRVLEEKTIRPVGSNQEVPVDVRIIAATNRKLDKLVAEGNFREDLFFRLNVLNLQIPPLRERLDDLAVLSRHFAESIAASLGIRPILIDDRELGLLSAYQWPGNIRELKNVIERSLLLNMLPSSCIINDTSAATTSTPSSNSLELAEIEKHHILKILALESGNKSAAARLLGVSRKTLERKVALWESLS